MTFEELKASVTVQIVRKRITHDGLLIGTLGKSELEMAMAVVVEYLFANNLEWEIPTRAQLSEFARVSDTIGRWCSNPFFRPDFRGLDDEGVFINWWNENPDSTPELGNEFFGFLLKIHSFKTRGTHDA
jgi:hypothetical protein